MIIGSTVSLVWLGTLAVAEVAGLGYLMFS